MIHQNRSKSNPRGERLGLFLLSWRLRAFSSCFVSLKYQTKTPSAGFRTAKAHSRNRPNSFSVSYKKKSPDRHRVWCQSGYWAAGREWLSPFIWRHALQNKTKKGVDTEAGRQGKHGSIADGCNGGTGALSTCPFRPVFNLFLPPRR